MTHRSQPSPKVLDHEFGTSVPCAVGILSLESCLEGCPFQNVPQNSIDSPKKGYMDAGYKHGSQERQRPVESGYHRGQIGVAETRWTKRITRIADTPSVSTGPSRSQNSTAGTVGASAIRCR